MNQTKICFFDDYWIDFRKGTVRRYFQPEIKTNFVDENYEANVYCSLIWCKEVSKYRLYYEVSPDLKNDAVRYLALAESDDGINFAKAVINDSENEKERNIVFKGITGLHGTSVIRDEYDEDPSRLYKCATMINTGSDIEPLPVVVATSADGLKWVTHDDYIVHEHPSDSLNGIYYNPLSKEYAVTLRGAMMDRRIAIRTSKDLIKWTPPVTVLHPGGAYNSEDSQTQFYSMWCGYMDGIFLGLLWNFKASLNNMDFSKNYGYMETELVYSYDGKYFMRTSSKSLIDRPVPPNYGCTQLSLMSMTESHDGKEYILSGIGSRIVHAAAETSKKLVSNLDGNSFATTILTIRKDGFCGIEGLEPGSHVVTAPLQLLSNDLSFNIRANCGYVRFALLKRNGEFWDGFSFDDSIEFSGDSVSVTPSWVNADISSLLNKQVRIGIELNGAIIHAINLTARPCIIYPQKGFHDPSIVEYALIK